MLPSLGSLALRARPAVPTAAPEDEPESPKPPQWITLLDTAHATEAMQIERLEQRLTEERGKTIECEEEIKRLKRDYNALMHDRNYHLRAHQAVDQEVRVLNAAAQGRTKDMHQLLMVRQGEIRRLKIRIEELEEQLRERQAGIDRLGDAYAQAMQKLADAELRERVGMDSPEVRQAKVANRLAETAAEEYYNQTVQLKAQVSLALKELEQCKKDLAASEEQMQNDRKANKVSLAEVNRKLQKSQEDRKREQKMYAKKMSDADEELKQCEDELKRVRKELKNRPQEGTGDGDDDDDNQGTPPEPKPKPKPKPPSPPPPPPPPPTSNLQREIIEARLAEARERRAQEAGTVAMAEARAREEAMAAAENAGDGDEGDADDDAGVDGDVPAPTPPPRASTPSPPPGAALPVPPTAPVPAPGTAPAPAPAPAPAAEPVFSNIPEVEAAAKKVAADKIPLGDGPVPAAVAMLREGRKQENLNLVTAAVDKDYNFLQVILLAAGDTRNSEAVREKIKVMLLGMTEDEIRRNKALMRELVPKERLTEYYTRILKGQLGDRLKPKEEAASSAPPPPPPPPQSSSMHVHAAEGTHEAAVKAVAEAAERAGIQAGQGVVLHPSKLYEALAAVAVDDMRVPSDNRLEIGEWRRKYMDGTIDIDKFTIELFRLIGPEALLKDLLDVAVKPIVEAQIDERNRTGSLLPTATADLQQVVEAKLSEFKTEAMDKDPNTASQEEQTAMFQKTVNAIALELAYALTIKRFDYILLLLRIAEIELRRTFPAVFTDRGFWTKSLLESAQNAIWTRKYTTQWARSFQSFMLAANASTKAIKDAQERIKAYGKGSGFRFLRLLSGKIDAVLSILKDPLLQTWASTTKISLASAYDRMILLLKTQVPYASLRAAMNEIMQMIDEHKADPTSIQEDAKRALSILSTCISAVQSVLLRGFDDESKLELFLSAYTTSREDRSTLTPIIKELLAKVYLVKVSDETKVEESKEEDVTVLSDSDAPTENSSDDDADDDAGVDGDTGEVQYNPNSEHNQAPINPNNELHLDAMVAIVDGFTNGWKHPAKADEATQLAQYNEAERGVVTAGFGLLKEQRYHDVLFLLSIADEHFSKLAPLAHNRREFWESPAGAIGRVAYFAFAYKVEWAKALADFATEAKMAAAVVKARVNNVRTFTKRYAQNLNKEGLEQFEKMVAVMNGIIDLLNDEAIVAFRKRSKDDPLTNQAWRNASYKAMTVFKRVTELQYSLSQLYNVVDQAEAQQVIKDMLAKIATLVTMLGKMLTAVTDVMQKHETPEEEQLGVLPTLLILMGMGNEIQAGQATGQQIRKLFLYELVVPDPVSSDSDEEDPNRVAE
ncbi:MAG: hypothetical protein CMB11_00080 [Euryarchaeota archaeon]|nr:hypothetical protein [Euryarchaeota archaeon]